MPSYWYSIRDNIARDDDNVDVIAQKKFNKKIAASRKPYFMTYVYPDLRSRNNAYIKNNDYGATMRFASYGIRSLDDLIQYEPKTKEMQDYLEYYYKYIPVGNNPCVVNRICSIFEKVFNSYSAKKDVLPEFDYNILKSHVEYSKKSYNDVSNIYDDYQRKIDDYMKRRRTEKIDSDSYYLERYKFVQDFKRRCELVCTNEEELCDIVVDLCYRTEKSKQFAWDVCGNVILNNILKSNNGIIHYPKRVNDSGEFEYCGEQFIMCEKNVGGDLDDSVE